MSLGVVWNPKFAFMPNDEWSNFFLDGLLLGICITIVIFPKKGIAPTYPKIQWLRFDDDPSPRKLAKTATACHLAVMSYPKLRDRTYHKFSMSQCQIISKDGSWTAGLEHWYSVVKKWMMSIQNQSNGKRQPDCHAESEVRAGGRWGWKRGWWPVSWQLSWEIPLDPCLYTWFGRQYSTFQSKNYWRTFRGNSQYLGWRTNGFPYISIGFLYFFFQKPSHFKPPYLHSSWCCWVAEAKHCLWRLAVFLEHLGGCLWR